MARKAVTEEQILEAADAVFAQGHWPVLWRVREELGGGSFATISAAMQSWRERHEQPKKSSGSHTNMAHERIDIEPDPVPEKPVQSLIGLYFWTDHEDADASRIGVVIGEPASGVYLVEVLNIPEQMSYPNVKRLVPIGDMLNWQFHDSMEALNASMTAFAPRCEHPQDNWSRPYPLDAYSNIW